MTGFPALPPARQCCGCAACHDACPRSAIRMVADPEGFARPVVDPARCIGCKRCEAACPVLADAAPRTPLAVFAAKNKDETTRLASSSGGVFSLLAESVLVQGGAVYGAAFDRETGGVRHVRADAPDGLAPIRGSKYVQSDACGTFRSARTDLAGGIPVLFSGTPCQIAALRRFLGKEAGHPGLLTVETICMGVSSPKAWKAYLRKRESERKSRVSGVSFRDKTAGWKRYSMALSFADGETTVRPARDDPYLKGMSARLFLRLSCSECRFRNLKSGADVTLGDFWNVHRTLPEMDDDIGTSLVLVNPQKGVAAMATVLSRCDWRESCFSEATSVNPALVSSRPERGKRAQALQALDGGDFDAIVERHCKLSFWEKTGKAVKKAGRRFSKIFSGDKP